MTGTGISPLMTLKAIRALCLVPGLTSAERQVGAAIIDHFSRDDGRCDPGTERLAQLTTLSVRTVLRAVAALDAKGLILCDSHGGLSQRNSYRPQWPRLEQISIDYTELFLANSRKVTGASPARRQHRHLGGDGSVTQTYSKNLIKEPAGNGNVVRESDRRGYGTVVEGQARKEKGSAVHRPRSSAGEAARAAAHRRWHGEALNQLPADVYVQVMGLDDKLIAEVDAAELARPGAGIALIRQRLGLTP